MGCNFEPDETLEFYLTVRLASNVDPESATTLHVPPPDIISLLLGLQVALEASYISSTPSVPRNPNSRPLPLEQDGSQLPPSVTHPNNFPPNTPFPFPSTSENDAPYAFSHGRPFESYVLSDCSQTRDVSKRAFTLLWDEKQHGWLAIYRLALRVGEYHVRIRYIGSPLLQYTRLPSLCSRYSL
jgi:hypothetical protein